MPGGLCEQLNCETHSFDLTTVKSGVSMTEVENNILRDLVRENLGSIEVQNNSAVNQQTLPSDVSGVMFESIYPSTSNTFAVMSEFKTNTDVDYSNSDVEVVTHNESELTDYNAKVSHVVELGDNTAPLYVSHVKMNFTEGDNEYISAVGSHTLNVVEDIDRNLFKALNSKYSNTQANPDNGIKGGFDNTFNRAHALYTEHEVNRDSDNNSLSVGSEYENKVSARLDREYNDNKLNNAPVYGSMKIVQDPLTVTVTSNVDNNSTLSVDPNSTQAPPGSYTEAEFLALFTEPVLPNVGPGYKLEIDLSAGGGYDVIGIEQNTLNNKTYNTSFNRVVNGDNVNLISVDDSQIAENLSYMRNVSTLDHTVKVINGNVEINSTMVDNSNSDMFEVLDGFEFLDTQPQISSNGFVKVVNTNNTLGDTNSRYTKVEGASDSMKRLVVNYYNDEADHKESVGVIEDEMKTNYTVEADVKCILKSTDTSLALDLWTSDKDVASNNNSVLVFQESPDVVSFDKNDIHSFTSNLSMNDASFALFAVKRDLEFEISQEGDNSLFRSGVGVNSNGEFKVIDDNIRTTARLSNVDLNELKIKDIRIGFTPRNVSDFTPFETSRTGVNKKVTWRTAEVDGSVIDNSNMSLPSGNQGYVIHLPGSQLISSGSTNNLLALIRDIGAKNGILTSPLTDISLTFWLTLPLYDPVENPEAKSEYFDSLAPVLRIRAEWPDNDPNNPGGFGQAEINSQSDIVYHPRNLPGKNKQVEYTFTEVPGNLLGEVNRKLAKITKKTNNDISVKIPLAAYDNLYLAFENVVEETTYYQVYTNENFALAVQAYNDGDLTKDKPRPHSDLVRYLNEVGLYSMEYWNKRTLDGRAFIEAKTVFDKALLYGFDVRGWYQSSESGEAQPEWLPLELSGNKVADFYLPVETSVMIKNDNVENFYGPLNFSVDATYATSVLGNVVDMASGNDMYYLNLTMAEGQGSITVKGYNYNVTDAVHIPDTWTPYKTDEFFLKDNTDSFVGTKYMNLFVDVSQNQVSPDQRVPDELLVSVKQTRAGNTVELFKFVLKEYMLENFNLVHCKKPVMRSDLTIENVLNTVKEETLFLTSFDDDNVSLYYSKLAPGVRVEFAKSIERHDSASFALKGDRIQVVPHPSYIAGRYHGAQGEEIKENDVALPLATESNIVRNVRPLQFRGYKNGQSNIVLHRTTSHLELDMEGESATTYKHDAGNVWKDKVSTINNINNGIGNINLKLTTAFSMLPNSDCTEENTYTVPMNVTFAEYTKKVTNPLETSLNEDVSGLVHVNKVHDYEPFDFVATRVKVYSDESYSLEYNIPDLKVYTNEVYVVNAENAISDWGEPVTYSDSVLRNSGFDLGVFNFGRSQINVSSHVGYATLPRASFYLEAFSVQDTPVSLPANLSTLVRKKWYADIDLAQNDHRPFSEDQAGLGQSTASVPVGSGLVNVGIELNITHETVPRDTNISNFSFDLSTNKLKIEMCVGLIGQNHNSCTSYFDGYVSELGMNNKWTADTNPSNSQENKRWKLNFKQLLGPLSSLIESEKESMLDRNIHINGIPSYALGEYALDLRLNDSVQMHYYGYNLVQDPSNQKVSILFERYSTAEALDEENWAKAFFNVPVGVAPLLSAKSTLRLDIPGNGDLTSNPSELADRIRSIELSDLQSLGSWQVDQTFGQTMSGEEIITVPVRTPVRMVALTTGGRDMLHELLHVTNDSPMKVIRAVRPDILRVKSLDGNPVFRITADGQVMAPMLDVYGIFLHRPFWFTGPVNGPMTQSLEFFYGNVHSMQSSSYYASIMPIEN